VARPNKLVTKLRTRVLYNEVRALPPPLSPRTLGGRHRGVPRAVALL